MTNLPATDPIPSDVIPLGVLTATGLHPVAYTARSFAEAARHEPPGVYTIGRTYQRDCVLLFDEHLDRLEQSAQLEGITATLDRSGIRAALRTLIDRGGFAESRYRIVIPQAAADTIYLAIERYQPVPATILNEGARVITVAATRRNPAAKTSDWYLSRPSAADTFPAGVYEGLLINEAGEILEGTSSNFYAIVEDHLRTAMEGVLEGISRRTLLYVLAETQLLPLDPRAVTVSEPIQEAFLSSAGRGIVPIIEIDGVPVAEGRPGPWAQRLQLAYNSWVAAHWEPL